MKVISTNIGAKKTILWKGKTYVTGIEKHPVEDGIKLGLEDVEGDIVQDRKYHGGVDKACYLFSIDQYDFWKNTYPKLEFHHGMFGENLTVEGFNEQQICIGDQFKIGDAIVEVSEPRQPCATLNARFQKSDVIKQFIQHGYCGAYLRIIQPGLIRANDSLELLHQDELKLSLFEIFDALYSKENHSIERIQTIINDSKIGIDCKNNLRKFWKMN